MVSLSPDPLPLTPLPGTLLDGAGAASLKVYGAKTCGDTKRARQFLDEHDIPYSWFDVDEDREALSLIKSVNNGNRTTPTDLLRGRKHRVRA